MTQNVNITVINHCPDDLVLIADNLEKGEFVSGYPTTTLYGTSNPYYKQNGQLAVAAVYHKHGPRGSVTYKLPNNQGQFALMFANPENPKGSGSTYNSYCYAPILNIPDGSSTNYYVTLSSASPMHEDPPTNGENLTYTVNFYPL